MSFKDYGIVDWFDVSKGFGVVKSVHSGEVFIHINNHIVGNISKASLVSISSVFQNVRNGNRTTGKDVYVWEGNSNDFCKNIYEEWKTKNVLFANEIEWLLSYGTEDILDEIITDKKLLKDERFEKYIRGSIYEKNKKEKIF